MLFSLLVKKTGTIEEKWKDKNINILQKNEIKNKKSFFGTSK